MARQAHHTHIQGEVLAAKLRPEAAGARRFQHLRFKIQITEGAAMGVAGRGHGVEILGAGHLDDLHGRLSRGAADDKHQVVGRAGRCAQREHLLGQELDDGLRVQHGARLLKQIRLVSRAAALGDEQEFVFLALHRIQIELRRQVGAGVLLGEHVQRGILRVAQVVLGVGMVDPFGERRLVAAAGPDLLALFAHDDRGPGVLAERQQTGGRHIGILEHRQRDHAVVLAGFRIVKDRRDLLQMLWPQEEIDVVESLVREQGQRLRLDAKHRLAIEVLHAHMALRELAVLGVIVFEFEQLLVMKVGCGHGVWGWKVSGSAAGSMATVVCLRLAILGAFHGIKQRRGRDRLRQVVHQRNEHDQQQGHDVRGGAFGKIHGEGEE